ncbi:MAG: hypothetical protein ACI4O7_11315 [Aristaeellaceae bacterium]
MKKIAGIVGIILACVFVFMAMRTTVPDKYISSYGANKMTEYVGGDAYNFIIEASLRGGEIAGAQITRAIYYAVAALLGVISLACLASDPAPAQPIDYHTDLQALSEKVDDAGKTIRQIQEKLDEKPEASVSDA